MRSNRICNFRGNYILQWHLIPLHKSQHNKSLVSHCAQELLTCGQTKLVSKPDGQIYSNSSIHVCLSLQFTTKKNPKILSFSQQHINTDQGNKNGLASKHYLPPKLSENGIGRTKRVYPCRRMHLCTKMNTQQQDTPRQDTLDIHVCIFHRPVHTSLANPLERPINVGTPYQTSVTDKQQLYILLHISQVVRFFFLFIIVLWQVEGERKSVRQERQRG